MGALPAFRTQAHEFRVQIPPSGALIFRLRGDRGDHRVANGGNQAGEHLSRHPQSLYMVGECVDQDDLNLFPCFEPVHQAIEHLLDHRALQPLLPFRVEFGKARAGFGAVGVIERIDGRGDIAQHLCSALKATMKQLLFMFYVHAPTLELAD